MRRTTISALPAEQDPDPEPNVSIILNSPLSVVTGRIENTSNVEVWSPLQEVSGVVKIASREPIIIAQVQISFEGMMPPQQSQISSGKLIQLP